MIPRRDAGGWRRLGRLEWKVEREDYPCDRSSRTNVTVGLYGRDRDEGQVWSLDLSLSRPWRRDPDEEAEVVE